eukprot:CAMPEP_0184648384 /NCGR_PEP_ID=MMETSP0308-20130426/5496_1 /TAXON_ID=38269 /ORGANISM="Gloeochaete witrockiana, Strain SAG 46.84" /LENGTH=33 /DNA_ID= /DNA_START= /DNA_END= /DNA_ORIENTATION=
MTEDAVAYVPFPESVINGTQSTEEQAHQDHQEF